MKELAMIILLTETTEPMLAYDLIKIHRRQMLVGTVRTIGTGVFGLLGVIELTNRSIWIKAKIVFFSQERLELEPLVLGVWMYNWV